MGEDAEAFQGSDLLGFALGRQPGASDLDDFVDFQIFYDESAGSGDAPSFLRARLCQAFELLLPELDRYLWHRDRFVLELCTDSEESHLSGHLRIGDGAEDEWFVVYLLRLLSATHHDVACRIVDGDGELLLIEAALAAPRWLTPSNAENRCWLRGGDVHLLPKPQAPEPEKLPLRQALARLRGGGHRAKDRVQKAIDARLKGYPRAAQDLSRHVARAVLPASVARILVAYPQLVSVAADYLPPPAVRELQRLRRDLPEAESGIQFDCGSLHDDEVVCIGVRFTRCQYARLMSLRCQMPQRFTQKHWRLPKGMAEVGSDKAMQLGAMLCCGLETAYLQGPRSATAVLRWTRHPEVNGWTDSAFLRHAASLKPPVDPGSQASRRAYLQQLSLDAAFRPALVVALHSAAAGAVDLADHWKDSDDPEGWLQVSAEELEQEMQARQAEFDAFDLRRSATRSNAAADVEGAADKGADELRKQLASMGSEIAGLLQRASCLEGVEPTGTGPAPAQGDSDSDASDLDVLGMEEEPEDASEGSEGSEEEAPGEGFRDYMLELDEQLEEMEGELPKEDHSKGLALGSRHIKVHGPGLELDLHAMEHVLASFCAEHQLEPGPASVLMSELGLAGGRPAGSSLDGMD